MDNSFNARCKLANEKELSPKVMNGGKCYFNYYDIVLGDASIIVHTPMPPYIRKAYNRPNAAFVSLFR